MDVRGGRVKFTFRGKSGIRHEVEIRDPRVSKVVRRCLHLPGQELFQYQDDSGQVHTLSSSDVNDFLHALCGERFTAKDFRTWHGSVLALDTLHTLCTAGEPFTVKQLLGQVATTLGNTPAVCRKAYIHPDILALGMELAGTPAPQLQAQRPTSAARELSAAEQRLVAYLNRNRSTRKARARRDGAPTA